MQYIICDHCHSAHLDETTMLVVNIAPMYVILVGKSGHMLVLKFRGTHWPRLTCSLSAVGCCWGSMPAVL